MESNNFIKKIFLARVSKMLFTIFITKFFSPAITGLLIIIICRCESNDRFYRPNLPEQLCSIGIINADDTARYISFEKSYQEEYPEELNDSLRNLAFTISSSNKELFSYKTSHTIKRLSGFKLPDSINFSSGGKYFLLAKENSTSEISAEITVPEPPAVPTLISIDEEIVTLSEPQECAGPKYKKWAVINISFIKNNEQKLYYALLVQGTGFSFSSLFLPLSGLLDFSVRESNSPGFFALMQGLKMYHYHCDGFHASVINSPVSAYFIEGSKIPDNKCNITLSVQFSDNYCVYEAIKAFHVKLLSIPEELYQFEKSLYTYGKVKNDPFSEPVYLNGNISGGNGVFAICRSSGLTINLSPWY